MFLYIGPVNLIPSYVPPDIVERPQEIKPVQQYSLSADYNVEIAAAREIGRETVQYVSNVYKYYIAYRMIIDQMERKKQLLKGNSE